MPNLSLEIADFVQRWYTHFQLTCLHSLQKDPTKRPSASELLYHPFIRKYDEADAELIFWLKDYLDCWEKVQRQNNDIVIGKSWYFMIMVIDQADFGLDEFVGLNDV